MKTQSLKSLLLIAGLSLSLLSCNKKEDSPTPTDPPAKVQPVTLTGNWDPFNKSQIEKLINTYGKAGYHYDASKPPYVVIDWDNTSVFLDIEEATLIYQLEHLIFGCTPAQLDVALRVDVPSDQYFTLTNVNGGKFKLNDITTDIVNSYTWLYANYNGLSGGGTMTLDQVKANPHYSNFVTKVRFMYDAIGETFSVDVSYPWVLYLFTGLTETQVRNMTQETVKWQLSQNIEKVTWTSPDEINMPNQLSGKVSISWKNGLRLVPEMQELYSKFRESGFDVWVCSASFVDVIKEISSNTDFGYNNSEKNVLAMELQRDNSEKIKSQFRTGYDQTQGKGKTYNIERFLSGVTGKYGYDPLFVAGDSDGDANMLYDFPGMKLGLVFNRLKGKGNILGNVCIQAVNNYGIDGTKYLLQGRNDNTGKLTPDQLFIKFGGSTGVALP